MKSRLLKTGISSIIFLLLVAVVFSVLQPIYKRVSTVLNSNEQQLLAMLEEKTGLSVSYKSLSPSILTGIHLKGIEVFEAESKKKVLTVQNAVLKYRMNALLKGDMTNAFTDLSISGVDFSFDNTNDTAVVQKLVSLFSNGATQQSTSEVMESIKQTLFSLPFSIKVKKVQMNYRDKGMNLTAGLNSISIKKKKDGSSIAGDVTGHLCMEVSQSTHQTAGMSFIVSCHLFKDLSGSSAICTLSEYAPADYTIGKMEYMLRYDNSVLAFRSLMNAKPFSVYGSYNVDSGAATASLKMTSFNPFSIITMKTVPQSIKQFEGTYITATVDLAYTVPEAIVSWKAQGGISLPLATSFSGEKITFNMKGDNETIHVYSLKAEGTLADASFTGTYRIPTMQPSGTFTLGHYLLPNGNTISGDLYIDPLKEGFFCFIPQLFLGGQTFTALQLTVIPHHDSFDFSFDMNDYSHADFESPADIKIDGSYTPGDKQYLQASVSISNLFLDTVAQTASVFTDAATAASLKNSASMLEPYIFTNELYVSTDFKSFSFNSPYSVIANTKQEKQLLFLSFDGNENSVQVSEFNLIYGNQSVLATFDADISPVDKQVLFYSDCTVNTIPYHFSGNFHDGKWLGITGDYGLDAEVVFDSETNGSVKLTSLPFAMNGFIFSLSTDLSFSIAKENNFNFDINKLEVEEVSGKIASQPKVALSGKVNTTGFVIDSLSYADTVSSLDGSGEVLWNINGGIFDSLTASLKMKSDMSSEKLLLNANCTNPLHVPFTDAHFKNDYYFTAGAEIDSFPVSRFMGGQLPDDTLSAEVSASGTINNPYVAVNVSGVSIQFNGAPLVAKGGAVLEDGTVTVSDLDMEWSGMKVSNTKGEFNTSLFTGTILSDFNLDMGGKTMFAPFGIKIVPANKVVSGGVPDSFSISFDTESIIGTLLNESLPVHLKFKKTPGRMAISSSEDLGVSGWVLDDGSMYITVDEAKPIHFSLIGKSEGQFINFACSNMYCDLSRISSLINSPFFSVYKGVLTGNLTISGLGSDPDMDGSFALNDFEFNLPDYIPQHMSVPVLACTCSQDEITVPETVFTINDRSMIAKAKVMLDRWTFGSVEASLKTVGKKGIPVDIKVPLVRMEGDVGLDTTLAFSDNSLDVAGTITLQNSEITAFSNSGASVEHSTSTSTTTNAPSPAMDMHIALKLLVDQKVKIVLNPFLQGLVAPQTPVEFNMDTTENTWNLKGDVILRGGEVSYLNRNFYLKEGRIVLNETQDKFDPNLTIRAETRERDDNGNPVTISLSAISQNVSRFSPVLSATPAKSESEIYEILGQILTADSNENGEFKVSNIIISGIDYGMQMTLFRKGEDALRDLCNFDIFSMRTMMLQNALKQGLNQNQDTSNAYTFGNYFDNSTVYIGKYFGSSLYADALLQWTYDSSQYTKDNPVSGIVFQPEIGLELSSPFANIRWNFTPNLESFEGNWYDPLVNSLVPATSITLSWKFSF